MHSSVIIRTLDVERIAILEPETQPPLIVDADAVLSGTFALQCFKTIRWRKPQILQLDRRMQLQQTHRRALQNIPRQAPRFSALEETLRFGIGERPDHDATINKMFIAVKRRPLFTFARIRDIFLSGSLTRWITTSHERGAPVKARFSRAAFPVGREYGVDNICYLIHIHDVRWNVDFHDDFVPEYRDLPREVQDELLAHIEVLEQIGPQLGRPRVDTLNGSRHKNMKELRFDAADGVWRFAFDPNRTAIVFCGGDKSGVNERRFYAQLIAKSDARFDAHLARIERRKEKTKERK